jgi:5-dehydro-2-deoxygluconokinase
VFTNVGADPFGEVALGELQAFGVDPQFVGVKEGLVTPLAFAVLGPPEVPQLLSRREPPAPDLQLLEGEVDPETVAAVPVLWISGGSLSAEPSATTVEAMLRARQRKRHTILDLDYRPTFWRSREDASARIGAAVSFSTIAIGNREECAVAVGTDDPRKAARRLIELGVELAIVKLGGDGALFANADCERQIDPPPIEVLCGLGAGDAFGGALCHGGCQAGKSTARSTCQCGRWDRCLAAALFAGHELISPQRVRGRRCGPAFLDLRTRGPSPGRTRIARNSSTRQPGCLQDRCERSS